DADVVVICHHGVRSRQVGNFLEHQGFSSIYNLVGGVDAWANDVDPAMCKY
ncbi:MAG: sulfurtransferase, partial [Candidatus Accumulibacter sp.]|nr:sulfurtransferase [Accumulibacter sp.]